MKKIFLSFSVGVAFLSYLVYQRIGLSPANPSLQGSLNSPSESLSEIAAADTPKENTLPIQTKKPAPTSPPSPSNAAIVSPSPAQSQPKGMYKDGTYQGSRNNAYYGYIQVKAVIQSGKITDIQFLEYPNDRRQSVSINTQALPYLKSETIQAQNAQVDTISGASYTSQAFRESLASALVQAKA